jgi:hypothetical protein
VAGVVEGQGVAGAGRIYRRQILLDGLEVGTRDVVPGCRHDACGHHEHVDVSQCGIVGFDVSGTHILGLGIHPAVVVAAAQLGGNERQLAAWREHVGLGGPQLVNGSDDGGWVVGPGEGAEEPGFEDGQGPFWWAATAAAEPEDDPPVT